MLPRRNEVEIGHTNLLRTSAQYNKYIEKRKTNFGLVKYDINLRSATQCNSVSFFAYTFLAILLNRWRLRNANKKACILKITVLYYFDLELKLRKI